MKIHSVLLLLLALFSFPSCFDKKQEQQEIIKTWKKYRTAFSNNLGNECSKYIDSESVIYYNNMLTLVRTADSAAVEQLRVDQKLTVLLARHTMLPEEIRKLNGVTFFENLIKLGEGGGLSNAPDFEFVTVSPTQANAYVVDSNGKRGLNVLFNKENDIWKINLAYLSGQLSKSDWDNIINESGKTEHEFINEVLMLANDKVPANSAWHPFL